MNKVVVLLALMLAALNAEARDRTGQFGVGAGIGPIFPAPWSQRRLKDNFSIGLLGGIWGRYYFDSPSAGMEISANNFTVRNVDTSARMYTINYFWRYTLVAMPRIKPLWAFGFGISELQGYFEKVKRNVSTFRIRLGAEYELQQNLDAGFYLDHYTLFRYQTNTPDMHVLAPTIAINYYFGEPTGGATSGIDSSRPLTSTVDSDNDGVLDSRDRCPGTPSGEKVNDLGCAIKQTFEVRLDVKFKPSTAVLDPSSLDDVAQLASLMKSNPQLRIEVEGHTDSKGQKATNEKLSIARANVVRDSLIKKYDISPDRVVAKGYASTQPIAPNTDSAGRALNRRVTAKVLAQ